MNSIHWLFWSLILCECTKSEWTNANVFGFLCYNIHEVSVVLQRKLFVIYTISTCVLYNNQAVQLSVCVIFYLFISFGLYLIVSTIHFRISSQFTINIGPNLHSVFNINLDFGFVFASVPISDFGAKVSDIIHLFGWIYLIWKKIHWNNYQPLFWRIYCNTYWKLLYLLFF